MCKIHIALQELQVVAVMLHNMVFQLSGKFATLHLEGDAASPFLSKLACNILNLVNKHGIILIPAYIPTHLNVETDYLS